MSAEVADALDKAAEVIETRGWFQGDLYANGEDDGACAVCAWGALIVAKKAGGDSEHSTMRERSAIRAVTGVAALANWNDTPGRTKDEVIAVLRAAAEAERAS